MSATMESGGLPEELKELSTFKPSSHFWPWVVCLLGLDYFSTLAYQPSITFEVAGLLGPIATAVVVLVTLFGALPVYWYLARRSPGGLGAIGMIERVVRGWRGKTLVLILLGFAATDFTMLKTISLADAAVHTLQSDDPGWQSLLADLARELRRLATDYLPDGAGDYFTEQLVATLLLGFIGFVFWFLLRTGFNRNAILLAVPLVGLYLLMTGVILGAGLGRLCAQPEMLSDWLERVHDGDWLVRPAVGQGLGWLGVVLVSFLVLPKLALGLSGFEMSMIVVPQVRGDAGDTPENPTGRVRNTRKVLVTAALIMAVYLLAASLVTCLLIPVDELRAGGKASDRALAYLAHGGATNGGLGPLVDVGAWFGSVYDTVTVLVLVLAGTSVVTALTMLLPQFLLRFGMEMKWSHRWGALLVIFALVNAGVTLFYQAKVSAQRDAYAVGVLVLISCAALVCALDKKQERKRAGLPAGFWWRLHLAYFRALAWGFAILTGVVALFALGGLVIALGYVAAILAMSIFARAMRADELRTIGFEFKNDDSKFFWDSLRLADFPVLVPHRPGRHEREEKEQQIRREHQLDPQVDIVFLEVEVDDPSNFYQNLLIEVTRENHRYVIKATRCVSTAHAIAAVALEMSRHSKPPGLHFGWTEMDLLTSSWSYLAFGEGNIPWKVRELLVQAEPDPMKRPRVIIG